MEAKRDFFQLDGFLYFIFSLFLRASVLKLKHICAGTSLCLRVTAHLFFCPCVKVCGHRCEDNMCVDVRLYMCACVFWYVRFACPYLSSPTCRERCNPTGCSHCQVRLISPEPAELQCLTLAMF